MESKEGIKQSVCQEENYSGLYTQHAASLRNFLYYRCGDLAMAEDMMQDAFIKLWKDCKAVVLEKAKSYLFTVGNRLFINHHHHQKVVLKFEKENPNRQQEVSPEYLLEEKQFKTLLEEAIANLSAGQREVFLMSRIDKLTYAEIADLLGVSVKAVEKRMHQALKNLKEKVEELKLIKI